MYETAETVITAERDGMILLSEIRYFGRTGFQKFDISVDQYRVVFFVQYLVIQYFEARARCRTVSSIIQYSVVAIILKFVRVFGGAREKPA
jgi:hypothetical protein